jgi:hypothetical protein
MFFFGSHKWEGESGERYRFKSMLTRGAIPETGGIYIFVRRRWAFFLHPLYIGKATNLRSRLFGHERWWEAWWKRGATERHILIVKNATDRARIEEDLIRCYQPKMNDMLVPRGGSDGPRDAYLRRLWRYRQWWRSLFRFKRGGRNKRAV